MSHPVYGLNELREMFLRFFESKGHLRLPSFSLIPQNDKSILLINAGMTPMKPWFKGEEEPPRRRVCTCQKCIRTGDIYNVGHTERHGTFFEMLGNFSFGDYFKHEAIAWSWEFLTSPEWVGLEPDRLYPSVFAGSETTPADDEAFAIWRDEVGIPAERISGGELTRLQTLCQHLSQRVVGQQEAVEKISRTIRRSRAGLKDENRPIGVFLFVGPTGVGKTLLAKEVSKWLFDEQRGLIRIDMSEYSEKHNVARLIGSPPGYVGYGEGGQLTEAVRRQPYAVILFDEIEKAHPEVFNSMLQIFDEGHLTDGSGRKVDFRNTIIIMTSNVGSRNVVKKSVQVGYSTVSKSATASAMPQCEYRKALEQTFAPEFLNRIDDIVLFRTLELSDVVRIIELELQGLFERTRRLGYKVKITDGAKRRLAAMGYESRYGVRSLKRTLMDNVEEPLSTLIIDGKLHEGDTVVVESDKSHGVKLRVA